MGGKSAVCPAANGPKEMVDKQVMVCLETARPGKKVEREAAELQDGFK
jgi:H2-forming N5,N10-methylenetetrahydromethanopterin dehydrogenase-like enzyme